MWQLYASVEVYTDETDQWHTADPLPKCRYLMTCVIINDICYLLGGHDQSHHSTKSFFCASVTSLVEKAKSPPNWFVSVFRSVWKTVTDTRLKTSAAASLSGCLLAVGGNDNQRQDSPAVHMFQPLTNSWVGMISGDLPVAVRAVTAIQLPGNELFICGGYSGRSRSQDVFIGSIADS